MIDASFDRHRASAIMGATQYDTGQRLRMHGIPPPEELLAGDDLLSGDTVTVMVHYAYEGDEQTDTRLAQWDGDAWCWLAEIPNAYLTRNCPVHVYVYVYWGENGTGIRGRTMYTGVFTPAYRPAPYNTASGDMYERWAALKGEADIVLSRADTAVRSANRAASEAAVAHTIAVQSGEKAEEAKDTAEDTLAILDALETRYGNLIVETESLPSGINATAAISGQSVTLGLPRGEKGEKGDAGEEGLSDITLSFLDGVLTITQIEIPAPDDTEISDMYEQWAALEAEADAVLIHADTAERSAQSAAAEATGGQTSAVQSEQKAAEAKDSAEDAQAILDSLESQYSNLSVETKELAPGSDATAVISGQRLVLGLPRGEKGEKGEEGTSDITLSFLGGVLTITQA